MGPWVEAPATEALLALLDLAALLDLVMAEEEARHHQEFTEEARQGQAMEGARRPQALAVVVLPAPPCIERGGARRSVLINEKIHRIIRLP